MNTKSSFYVSLFFVGTLLKISVSCHKAWMIVDIKIKHFIATLTV